MFLSIHRFITEEESIAYNRAMDSKVDDDSYYNRDMSNYDEIKNDDFLNSKQFAIVCENRDIIRNMVARNRQWNDSIRKNLTFNYYSLRIDENSLKTILNFDEWIIIQDLDTTTFLTKNYEDYCLVILRNRKLEYHEVYGHKFKNFVIDRLPAIKDTPIKYHIVNNSGNGINEAPLLLFETEDDYLAYKLFI